MPSPEERVRKLKRRARGFSGQSSYSDAPAPIQQSKIPDDYPTPGSKSRVDPNALNRPRKRRK